MAEVDHHIARSVTRPRRAAARNLTPKQIDGELGAEDSCDEVLPLFVPELLIRTALLMMYLC